MGFLSRKKFAAIVATAFAVSLCNNRAGTIIPVLGYELRSSLRGGNGDSDCDGSDSDRDSTTQPSPAPDSSDDDDKNAGTTSANGKTQSTATTDAAPVAVGGTHPTVSVPATQRSEAPPKKLVSSSSSSSRTRSGSRGRRGDG